MESADLLTQAMPILGAIVTGGAGVVQGVATRVLGDLVIDRLRSDGHGDAWDEYTHSPDNDALVRHLLKQAREQDPTFRSRFDNAVRAAAIEQRQQARNNSITVTNGGNAQIGDRGDMITADRVVTRGGVYHQGDVRNRVTDKKSSPGAYVTAVVIVIVVVIALVFGIKALLNHVGGNSLNANSTCQQFLNASAQSQQQALVDIAAAKGIGGFGSPLALPEIQYECSYSPGMTLGSIVERDKNEFG
jgi:hypothetical protein